MALAEREMPDDTAPAAATPRTLRSTGELRLIMAGLMLALTLASLDGNIVTTALPQIVSDLGGLAHLSWVVTAFALASTASTPFYGKFSDLYGRKPAFMVSISVFLIGSALCGLARSMTALIVFRALQGIGAGGLMTLTQTTIGDLVSPRERGRYQGLFAAVFAVCSVIGPLLGGFLTDALSWHWIFYVNIPVGFMAMAIIASALREPARRLNRPIDLAGFGLLTTGTICAVLALSWGGTSYPWHSPVILGLGIAVISLFAMLVPVERRVAEPVLPPSLFHNNVFVLGTSVVTLTTMALFGALVFVPLFFQLTMGASASAAGLRMTPVMAGIITSSFLGGRLVSAIGRYKMFPVIGLATAIAADLSMSWCARHHAGLVAIELTLAALGLGTGLVMPNITVAIQNAVPRSELGVATASTAFFRSLGSAVGVALSGTILTTRLDALVPGGFGLGHSILSGGMGELRHLAPGARAALLAAYGDALSATFLGAGLLATIAFGFAIALPDRTLER